MLDRHLASLDRYVKLWPLLRGYRSLCRGAFERKPLACPAAWKPAARPRVLVVGAYLSARDHTAAHLARQFANSRWLDVTQRWACIGPAVSDRALAAATALHLPDGMPKFPLMNRLMQMGDTLGSFDYVVVSDDDVIVQAGFLDAYIALQQAHDLALAQPARTPWSCGSKAITVQHLGQLGRYTRFVEIGPVFSIHRRLYDALLPFDEGNAMGWGFDYRWPKLVEARGLRMGIVDHTPVDHSLRPLASAYSGEAAKQQMHQYLAAHEHLSPHEAQTVIGAFRTG
jgi:hypothetical protein